MRPVLFSLGGFDFVVSPVFAGLGALLAYLYCWFRRDELGVDEDGFWNLMLWLSAGTFLGGIVLYFFFFGGGVEGNLAFLAKRRTFRGGAFYGNFWGAFATVALFARTQRLSAAKLADVIGPAAMLGLAVARIGCFLKGCCHGIPTHMPWGVEFTHPRASVRDFLQSVPLHPTQLYEMATALLVFAAGHFWLAPRVREGRLPAGAVFAFTAAAYSAVRFGVEFLRGRDLGVLRPFGLTSNQVFALLSIAAAAALYRQWQNAKR